MKIGDLPPAGGVGPEYVDFPMPARAGVNYTLSKSIVIRVERPDGTHVVTWSSADLELTFENVTASTCTVRRVYAPAPSEVPFEAADGNTSTCKLIYRLTLIVDGVPVLLDPACQLYRNPDLCFC